MCQFELAAANHHLVSDDRNSLILLRKETARETNMTPQLALLMKMKIYIEWTEERRGKELFTLS